MKKTAISFLALVMLVSMFCGCTTRDNNPMPNVSPIVTTTPGDDIIPDGDVVPDAEDGLVTDEDTEDGVIRDEDGTEDGLVTDDKNETLPAEGDNNTAG